MNLNPITPLMGPIQPNLIHDGSDDVVEIGLLLPTKRAAALLLLAQERRESVGQVLRKMIDRELFEID